LPPQPLPTIFQQDPLGKSISFKRRYTNDHDVWAGPLSDGSTVAGKKKFVFITPLPPPKTVNVVAYCFLSVVINWQNSARSLTLDLADVGFTSATANDLLSGISLGRVSNS